MMFRLLALAIGLSLCFGAFFAADIQSADRSGINRPDSDFNKQLNVARKLLRERNYAGASAILESLWEVDPHNQVVYNQLRSCYFQLKQFFKADQLARRMIKVRGDNYRYHMQLAEALLRQNNRDSAQTAYEHAIDNCHLDVSQLQVVIRSMVAYGLEDGTLTLIRELRTSLADSSAFAVSLGGLLEKQNKYSDAAAEYFTALSDSTNSAITAEKRLLSLLAFSESADKVERVLLDRSRSKANKRSLRLLSTHYLKSNQFQKAFEFAVAQDSAEGSNGVSLLRFLRSCVERKLDSESIRTAEYLLGKYKGTPIMLETHFIYADALTRLGLYDRAIAEYDSIFATYLQPRDQAEALYRIGSICLNHLYDYERARKYYDSVIAHYPAGIGYIKSRMAVPHCFLRQGELGEAASRLGQIQSMRTNQDNMEEIAYYRALVHFFAKQFDSASTALKKLTVDYPRGYYFNDALSLMLILDEADGAKQEVYDFSNALLFQERRMPDSTLATLEEIAGSPGAVLADVALYRMSQVTLEGSDSTQTVELVDRLAEGFPESYYLPYALKTKADILMSWPGTGPDEAKGIYRRLLEEFSDYPFAAEVRKVMREIEAGESPSS
ncbi:MAG: tetratricopeptide repeat protein [Candidatus Zixiibacteriota bacterium]